MSFYCALEKKSFRPGRLNFALARLNSDIRKLFSIVRKTKMVFLGLTVANSKLSAKILKE
jgi:hypothetical protein